jgi:hypothetical protein
MEAVRLLIFLRLAFGHAPPDTDRSFHDPPGWEQTDFTDASGPVGWPTDPTVPLQPPETFRYRPLPPSKFLDELSVCRDFPQSAKGEDCSQYFDPRWRRWWYSSHNRPPPLLLS